MSGAALPRRDRRRSKTFRIRSQGRQTSPLWPFEKFGQDVRTIGHDAVNPMAKQAAHVGLRVDGPHVNPKSTLVGGPDESWRHHAQPVVGLGTLQRPVARSDEPAQVEATQDIEEDQFGARRGRRHPSTRNLAKATYGKQVFGDHKCALLSIRRPDDLPHGFLDSRSLALYLDIYWHLDELVVD